ncbi:MAG: hypothetical protein ACP5OG_00740 [Candidatus Nanoarchaeia archaeon]
MVKRKSIKQKQTEKRAALELSIGTIVILVIAMTMLILGLVLVKKIFSSATSSVTSIDDKVKQELNGLFTEEESKLVVSLGSQNTAKVAQGTKDFGIAIGFVPDDPAAWGDKKTNCKYSIGIDDTGNYCVKKGWSQASILNSISTGYNNVIFHKIDGPNGYDLIKITIPEKTPTCLQRFTITVTCPGYDLETAVGFFDIEVIKKGLF